MEIRVSRKHREKLDHSGDRLPGSKVVKDEIESQINRVRGQSGRDLPKGELAREINVDKLRVE